MAPMQGAMIHGELVMAVTGTGFDQVTLRVEDKIGLTAEGIGVNQGFERQALCGIVSNRV